MISRRWLAVSLVVFLASALASGQTPAKSSVDELPDAPSTTGLPKPEPSPTGPTIVMDTTMGRLTCKTFVAQAPITVANFIALAEGTRDWTSGDPPAKHHGRSLYNGTIFHRVIPGFMIQGGDPMGTGEGDPGYLFPDEIDGSLTFSVGGRLAMANSGPGADGGGTNGSQFFITEAPQPELNGKHTIFGQCDAHSTLLAASIARVPRNRDDKPLTPVVLNRVTIVRDGQPMPPDRAAASPTQTSPTTSLPSATHP